MATYISQNGNPEVWAKKPAGYFTPEEWAEAHPQPAPPAPPAPTYDEQRRAAILEKWPLPAQLEALTEAAESPQRPEKLAALLADIQGIKALYPKPESATEPEAPAGA